MTERTVTVQTEQEETITLCDHCGLSDDAGEIVSFRPKSHSNWNDVDCLDLHKHCLEDMGVDVPAGPTFRDLVDEETNYSALPVLAFSVGEIVSMGAGGLALYLHTTMVPKADSTLMEAAFIDAISTTIGIVGVLFILVSLFAAWRTAHKAKEGFKK